MPKSCDMMMQFATAGNQFDGTPGKGKFEFKSRTGVTVSRVSLNCGTESKNITIKIASNGHSVILSQLTGSTLSEVLWNDPIAVGPEEWIEFITTGATAAMSAKVLFEV